MQNSIQYLFNIKFSYTMRYDTISTKQSIHLLSFSLLSSNQRVLSKAPAQTEALSPAMPVESGWREVPAVVV
jgi:hypothetical protein